MRHGWVTGWGRPRLVRRVCIWRGCSEHAILRACVHPLSAHVTGLPLELLQERLLDDSAVLRAHLIWWYSCGGEPWRIGMHVLRCDVVQLRHVVLRHDGMPVHLRRAVVCRWLAIHVWHRLTEWCVWCVWNGLRTAVPLLKLRLGLVLGVRLLRILT